MSVETLERRRTGGALEPTLEPRSTRSRRWPLALAALFCVATAYHWLQSRGHVTPAIFTDELMFSELARSLAAGDGLTVRGESFLFPAFLPALVQAPVWLLDGAAAYGAAKALNAVLMCSAVFPAWALARLVVRPAYAFGVAAAAVAGGAMLYHSYLTSEALAFPVFLLAVFVSVRAVSEPSLRWDALAVLVLGAAVLTRAQFVVLPVAFVLTVLLVGRPVRRHALALSALAILAAGAAVGRCDAAGNLRRRPGARLPGARDAALVRMDRCAPSLHRRHGRRPRSLARSRLRDGATASTGRGGLRRHVVDPARRLAAPGGTDRRR